MSNVSERGILFRPRDVLRLPALVALLVVMAVEFLGIVAVTVMLVVELFAAHATNLASAIALTVLCVVAVIWMGFMIVGLLRAQPWVRSGTIVWQFLQIAIAVGAFEGVFRVPWIGWVLLVPAVIGILLALSRASTRVLARPDRSFDETR